MYLRIVYYAYQLCLDKNYSYVCTYMMDVNRTGNACLIMLVLCSGWNKDGYSKYTRESCCTSKHVFISCCAVACIRRISLKEVCRFNVGMIEHCSLCHCVCWNTN